MLDAWVVWQVPAEPGPHPGRGAEAGHRPQAVSQGREGPLPLQRTWGRTAAAFSVTYIRYRYRFSGSVLFCVGHQNAG